MSLFWLLAVSAQATAVPVEPVLALPPPPLVREALDAHPVFQAARAEVAGAQADQRGSVAGPHEVTVQTGYHSRWVRHERRFNEGELIMSRSLRLSGKGRLDRQAGRLGVAVAENRAEDARHQVALLLNTLWWSWAGAEAQARIDAQAVANYAQSLKGLQRRLQWRDAAVVEVDQARAALAQAQLLARQSEGRALASRARLLAQFPNLPLPQSGVLPLPESPAAGLAPLRDLVIARSHEIAAADAEAARLEALAERSRRDRIADPTVGVRLFTERGGHEKGIGVVAAIPLGGKLRSARADRAEADAVAGRARSAATRYDVREMADTDLAEAEASLNVWHEARTALSAQLAVLSRQRRGHGLGVVDLADLLLAERLAHDAFRSEIAARTTVLEALTRLRIDSHELWLNEEDHPPDPGRAQD